MGGRVNPLGTFPATRDLVAELCDRYTAPGVLDMGCGSGHLLAALAPLVARGVGVDRDPVAIRRARRRAAEAPHLTFRVASAETLGRPASRGAEGGPRETAPSGFEEALPREEPFDLALFVGSLEHMDRPLRALFAARDLIHPEGRIVIVAVSPQAPHARISRRLLAGSSNPVVAHMTMEELTALARGAGLQAESVRPLGRGSGTPWIGAALDPLLRAYDRAAGPTRAAILRAMEAK